MLSWYDTAGQATSPPLPDQLDLSAARLYLFFNKQKIKCSFKKQESLGLFIRGGQEYGLGIYVTKVIPNSPSERAGIQPGDQILKCNGRSFLGITHQQAVQVLRSSRSLSLLIDRIGKMPAMSSADEGSNAEPAPPPAPPNAAERRKWLMLSSAAEALLSPDECSHVMHCVARYTSGALSVAHLVDQLFVVLTSKLKMSILPYVRNFVSQEDVDRYDAQLLKKELETLHLRRHGRQTNPSELDDTINELDNVSIGSSVSSEPDTRPYSSKSTCTCGSLQRDRQNPGYPREPYPSHSLASSNPGIAKEHHYSNPVVPITSSLATRVPDFALNPAPAPKKQTLRALKRKSGPPIGPGASYGTWVSTSTSSDKGYQSEDDVLAKGGWDRERPPEMQRATSSADVQQSIGYHELWARSKKVWVPKFYPNLGLRVAGGARTKQRLPIVVRIEPYGCAAEAKDLREGSIILGVDGQSLVGLDHEEVVWKIARAFRNKSTKLMIFNVVNHSLI